MPDTTLRQRQAALMRQRLVETALSHFEARGYDNVTVEEIADAAMVSPRTFYRYFGSKEGVLFDQQDELLAVLHATIVTEDVDAPPIAAVRAAIVTLVKHTADLVEVQRRRTAIYLSTTSLGTYERTVVRPRWEQTLVGALAERLHVDPTADPLPGLLADVAIAVMDSVLAAWMSSGGDLEELVAAHFQLLAAAVTATDERSASSAG